MQNQTYQTKYQINIVVDKVKSYTYNLEVLIGQKPKTSIEYILDYVNDVKGNNINYKDYGMFISRDLFIAIFGNEDYYIEYLKSNNRFISFGMIETNDVKNTILFVNLNNVSRGL